MSASSNSDAWLWPPRRRRLAEALLEADEPLTGAVLGAALGTAASNVNRELVALAKEDLVTTRFLDPAEAPQTGRPSRFWVLSDEQRDIVEQVLSEHADRQGVPQAPPARRSPLAPGQRSPYEADRPSYNADNSRTNPTPGQLRRQQELVIANVSGPRAADLMGVLARGEQSARAHWTALCGEELVFAFDGPDPVPAALRLLAFLHSADVPVRRATVARLWSRGEFPHRVSSSGNPRR